MGGDVTPDRVLQLGLGFWGSKALLSAVELGVFTELARRPLDRRDADRAARACTRAAPATSSTPWSPWACSSATDGRYANTPETDLFLDRAKPTYVGGMLEMANARLYAFWGRLTEALRTGRPQNEAKASRRRLLRRPLRRPGPAAAVPQGDDRASAWAPPGRSRGKFPWADYRTVRRRRRGAGRPAGAGGPGPPAPDRRRLRPAGRSARSSRSTSPRSAWPTGCASTPATSSATPCRRADVLVMGHILHDWDLDREAALIAKAYAALPPGGALIVYEAHDRRRPAGERVRPADEPEHADRDAGRVRLHRGRLPQPGCGRPGSGRRAVEHLVGPDSMVVGVK